MYLLVLRQLIVMLLIVVLSFAFSRKSGFGDKEPAFLSRLLLYMVNPCLIIDSFNVPYDAGKMKQLLFVIAVCIAVHLLLTLIVQIFIRSKTEAERALDGLDRIGIVFTNCGFIGIPLISGVFGPEGVFYLMGYLAVFNIYLWTYGEYQMSGHINWKKVITNPNVLAVIGGIILFRLPVQLPDLIARPIKLIGGLNTALSMILLGMLFAGFRKSESGVSYASRVVRACVFRLVVSSVAVLALLYAVYLLFPSVPDLREMLFVIYIASLCPIGMSVSTFACVFGKDASYTSLIVSATSVLCIATVPAFVKLAELLIR